MPRALYQATPRGAAAAAAPLEPGGSVFPAQRIVTARELADGPGRAGLVAGTSEPQRRRAADLFEWRDEHAVGVARMDLQHRRLLALTRDLAQIIEAGRPWDEVAGARGVVISFTLTHFNTEERLMRRHPGFAEQAAHETEHRRLVDDLRSLSADDERSPVLTAHFLHQWMIGHIEGMDKPLGSWLREHGVT